MSKSQVAIVTDTTACLPAEIIKQFEIEVVPVVFMFGKTAFRDGIDMTTGQFYEKLQKAKQLPTTSGGLTGPYLEAFTRAAKKASAVLCLNISSKLSAMFKSAGVARELAGKTLPGINIEIIDTGTAAGAQGLVVTAAARAAREGASLPEIMHIVRDVMSKVYLFAALDTLHFLVKGGRAPKVAEITTSLLQVKPILSVVNGVAASYDKCITMTSAMRRLIEIVADKSVRNSPLHLVVMHAGAPDRGQKLYDLTKQRFTIVESGLWEFTPVMGVHTGPGLVGIAFYYE